MGRRNRTRLASPGLFFVTTTLLDWHTLFNTDFIRTSVVSELFGLYPKTIDALMGYVIMPSHVHLLIGCSNGGRQLSKAMQLFKGRCSYDLFSDRGQIWIRRFDDLMITSEKQFRIKLQYIHDNPVRAGLVKGSVDWQWSSAKFWLLDEPSNILTKNWDWFSQ